MAIPDINHKVCIVCDHYTEDDCPYCGMGFEGFSIEKHDMEVKSKISQKIRVDVIDECKKIVMAECITTCEYLFSPNCIECMTNKMEKLKEQSNE